MSTPSDGDAVPPLLRSSGFLACAVAVALAGAVYLNALHNPFIYDDHRLIVENRTLNDPTNLQAILWRDVTRPVVSVSYALDRAIWGSGPFGHHVTNVALHMINVGLFAWLIWCACQDWSRRSQPVSSAPNPAVVAPVGALLFAVHPLMTEAVGYISGRSEVLSATFFLLGLHAARRYMSSDRYRWLPITWLCWITALGSRETAVLLPVVLILFDRWFVSPAMFRRRLQLLHMPLMLGAALAVVVRLQTFLTIEHGGQVAPAWNLVWVELDVIRRYLTLLVLPTGQTLFHAVEPAGPMAAQTWLAVLVIGVAIVAAWRFRRTWPLVTFGAIWFFLLLAPSSLLVVFDRGEPMAEHRVYLASLGLFVITGVAIDHAAAWFRAQRTLPWWAVTAAVGALTLSLAGRTVLRNQIWADPILVWLEAGERAPDHWFPALMLGEELHRRGQHDQAIAAFRRALQSRPGEPAPHVKLAVCLVETKDLDAAAAEFTTARRLDASSPEASNGLATVALLRGDFAAARRGYLDTLALDAENIAARRGLAAVEEAPGGNPAEALRWCEDIRRLAPETPGIDECIRRNQERVAAGRDAGS